MKRQWIESNKDKILHFFAGSSIGQLIWFLVFGFIESEILSAMIVGPMIATIFGFIAGMAKEQYDAHHLKEGYHVDSNDLLFTALGSFIGALLMDAALAIILI